MKYWESGFAQVSFGPGGWVGGPKAALIQKTDVRWSAVSRNEKGTNLGVREEAYRWPAERWPDIRSKRGNRLIERQPRGIREPDIRAPEVFCGF